VSPVAAQVPVPWVGGCGECERGGQEEVWEEEEEEEEEEGLDEGVQDGLSPFVNLFLRRVTRETGAWWFWREEEGRRRRRRKVYSELTQ